MSKGTYKIVKGDATKPVGEGNKIIVHVCNDANKFGAGFTRALKKWPEVEETYRKGTKELGNVSVVKINEELWVINMIAQHGIVSKDNPKPIRYKALMEAMERVKGFIVGGSKATDKKFVIHAPKFGSGLAGGNFQLIFELIRELWLENGISVIIYEF